MDVYAVWEEYTWVYVWCICQHHHTPLNVYFRGWSLWHARLAVLTWICWNICCLKFMGANTMAYKFTLSHWCWSILVTVLKKWGKKKVKDREESEARWLKLSLFTDLLGLNSSSFMLILFSLTYIFVCNISFLFCLLKLVWREGNENEWIQCQTGMFFIFDSSQTLPVTNHFVKQDVLSAFIEVKVEAWT